MNTCPICDRTWTITRWDDCLIPACGCYGTDPWSGKAPCERCGLQHALLCLKMPPRSSRASTDPRGAARATGQPQEEN